MTHIILDFETRSMCELKKAGAWAYSMHPSTEVMCCAFKIDCGATKLWLPGWVRSILVGVFPVEQIPSDAGIYEAHNAEFERVIWENVCIPKYGWPPLPPLSQWRCSAAKAAALALPRPLEQACKVLKLSKQKNMDGHRLMLKMSKPRKPTKNNPAIWHEDPEDFKKLIEYCIDDVEAEHTLSRYLPALSGAEQKVWELDQLINRRGFCVDVDTVQGIVEMLQRKELSLLEEFAKATGGLITSPRQTGALLEWITANGVERTTSVDKASVLEVLSRENIPAGIRRALEIRQELGKSSTAKFKSMLASVCPDGRIRGSFMFHGAQTGRWSGKGVQPHNMPRMKTPNEACLQILKEGEFDLIEALYDTPSYGASSAIRGMITAGPGKEFICADYSAIEGRVLAWLAGEEKILDAYRAGLDPYKLAASGILKKPYDSITKDERQSPGKVAELACIQGSQRVSTQFGLIPIERVCRCMTVWDGKEWVHHEGAIYRGYKDVIEHDGLIATPDHIIFTEPSKMTFKDAEMRKLSLKRSALVLSPPSRHTPRGLSPNCWYCGERLPDFIKAKIEERLTETRSQVWDILNAGPRHCFTVEGKLVSNCGYQGGPAACRKFGAEGTDEELRERIVTPWRENRPLTVALWKSLEQSAIRAVLTNNPQKCGKLGFYTRNDFLFMVLPSGRKLAYYKPAITEEELPWSTEDRPAFAPKLRFWGVDSTTKQWVRQATYGGKLAENCLAGESRVLTYSGWKHLSKISDLDLIWDGIDFVSHGGIVNKGCREVICIDGILITPDHKILKNGEWVDASSYKRYYRNASRITGYRRLRGIRWKKIFMECKVRMRESVSFGERRFFEKPVLRVHAKAVDFGKTQNPWENKPPHVRSMESDDRPMQTPDSSSMEKLRSEGDICLQVMEKVCSFLGRHAQNLCSWIDNRKDRQQRELLPGKLQMGNAPGSESKSTRNGIFRRGAVSGVRRKTRRCKIDSLLPTREKSARAEVYDILNCGPRNQFFVRGDTHDMIVHNCTQAVSRDVLVAGMFNAERAGFPIELHVHDEAVAEVEKGIKTLDELCKELCALPAWADGLPMKAEGWVGKRYKKG